jgi:hypothetical protein
LRRSNLSGLLALAVVAVLVAFSQADALQSLKASKVYFLTIEISPTPAPVGFAKPAHAPSQRERSSQLAALVADPAAGPAMVALGPTAWDVAPGPAMVAQSSVQGSPVPVQFVVKPDPNANFLKIIPHAGPIVTVPYGVTTLPCAFEIFTFFTTAYNLDDWGFQTTISGSGVGFPVNNFPMTSNLAWSAQSVSTTFSPYKNSGSPGEKTWIGTAGQTQQHCIDLKITVPASTPWMDPSGRPHDYAANIQYALYVN